MAIGIRVRGLAELQAKLGRMGRDLKPELRRATNEAVLYVHSQVPDYPAPPATRTYRRTGTLGRSITTEVRDLGNEFAGVIGTDVVYAPWVISSEGVGGRGPQARVHAGRWYTLQGVVKAAARGVVGIYEAMVKRLIG